MSDFLLGRSDTTSAEVRCGGRVIGQGGKRMVIGSTASATTLDSSSATGNPLTTMNVSAVDVPSCSNGVNQTNFATPQSYAQSQLPPAWIPNGQGIQDDQTSLPADGYIDINQLFGDQVFLSSEPQLSLSNQSVDGETKSTLHAETIYLQVPPAPMGGQQQYYQMMPTQPTQQQNAQPQQMQYLSNGDWKPDAALQGIFNSCQNSTILNDDQNSMQSSVSHSSTPSPRPQLTIPPNSDYPGKINLSRKVEHSCQI